MIDLKKVFCEKVVLVTGANGFIGNYLISSLLDFSASVIAVDNCSSAYSNLRPNTHNNNLVVRNLDIASSSFTNFVLSSKIDYVFHLAGNSYVPTSISFPILDFDSNARNSLALLDALRKSDSDPVILLASSAAIYGNPDSLPINESAFPNPISPYGASKLSAENYFKVFSKLYNSKTVIARPFSVYGEGQQKQVVFDFMKKLSRDNHLEINSSMNTTRDFIHVSDVAKALLFIAAEGEHTGQAYNIASGNETSIGDLALMIAKIMGINMDSSCNDNRMGDPLRWKADISKLEKLGYQNTVSLRDGLSKTFDWFRSNYK